MDGTLKARLLEHPEMLPEGFSFERFMEGSPVILQDGEDYAIFERVTDRIYAGHYLFKKVSIKKIKAFLKEIFTVADVVLGDVPEGRREVVLLSKSVGFKTLEGTTLYLTKEQFNG